MKRYLVNVGRFWPGFLDNCRVFFFQKKARTGPISIVWDITSRCNLGCIFCDWSKANYELQQKELSTSDKISIINQLGKNKVWFLSFCGGEPLLCPDLEIMLKETKKAGMVVNVSTNGLLLEEKAEGLVNSGIDFITVSVDSHKAEVLDELRGREGLFNQIEKGIKRVRELSGAKPIHIEARCLVHKLNYLFLENFVDFWRAKVDSIIFKPIYQNPFVLYKNPPALQFNLQDEVKFRDCWKALLKKYPHLNTRYHRHIPDFFFKPEELGKKFLCFAGTFFAGIDSEGNLYPCQEISSLPNKPLGNLLREDLLSLWNLEEARKVRSYFKKESRCNCWLERFSLSLCLEGVLRPLDKLLPFSK